MRPRATTVGAAGTRSRTRIAAHTHIKQKTVSKCCFSCSLFDPQCGLGHMNGKLRLVRRETASLAVWRAVQNLRAPISRIDAVLVEGRPGASRWLVVLVVLGPTIWTLNRHTCSLDAACVDMERWASRHGRKVHAFLPIAMVCRWKISPPRDARGEKKHRHV